MNGEAFGTAFSVREAIRADALGIAQVHVESWRTTYQGLMPDAVLAALSVEERTARWAGVLNDETRLSFLLVAESTTAGIIGFVIGGPLRMSDLPFQGEVYALYLLQRVQRRGIGTALFRESARRLWSAGHRSLLVWVLAGNPAHAFYEAMGGIPVGTQMLNIGGADLEEIGYGWPDIRGLAGMEQGT